MEEEVTGIRWLVESSPCTREEEGEHRSALRPTPLLLPSHHTLALQTLPAPTFPPRPLLPPITSTHNAPTPTRRPSPTRSAQLTHPSLPLHPPTSLPQPQRLSTISTNLSPLRRPHPPRADRSITPHRPKPCATELDLPSLPLPPPIDQPHQMVFTPIRLRLRLR